MDGISSLDESLIRNIEKPKPAPVRTSNKGERVSMKMHLPESTEDRKKEFEEGSFQNVDMSQVLQMKDEDSKSQKPNETQKRKFESRLLKQED